MGQGARNLLDPVVRMTVGNDQVLVSVMIRIEKPDSPAAVHVRRHADSGWTGLVGITVVPAIPIDREFLAVEVADEEILAAIAIVVGRVDPHPRPRCSVGVVSHFGCQPDFLEAPSPAIPEEKVGHRIVRNKKVEPPVAIDIGGDGAKGFPPIRADPRILAAVSERIPLVVKEPAWPRLVGERVAVVPGSAFDARLLKLLAVSNEVADVEIESCVCVVVEPYGGCIQAGSLQAQAWGEVGESAIAIIAEQRVGTIVSEVQIGPPVVVEIGG